MMWRIMGTLFACVLVFALTSWGWRRLTGSVQAPGQPPAASSPGAAPAILPSPGPPPVVVSGDCGKPPAFAGAAAQNAQSLTTAAWSVFGRPETGWRVYEPLAAHEVGVGCSAASPAFAAALANWQAGRKLAANGVMDEPTLDAMRIIWLRRRPFLAQSAQGACPAPPAPSELAQAGPDEGYSGKSIQLRPQALAAYRQLRAAAKAAGMARDRQMLTIFSGYRDPVQDAASCAATGGCGTIAKANCSAHRTGLAMDIYLGAAPGSSPASTDDANRLYLSHTPAYLWLVANAARFGFVNYPFEPWHWEWAG